MKKHKPSEPCFAAMGIELDWPVYNGLGQWEGIDLVFKFRVYSDGNKIDGIEVLTQISPVSFILRHFESRNGRREDARWTGIVTKAE
jgi:hypothetical protein